jgi:predicted transcriptional regulator
MDIPEEVTAHLKDDLENRNKELAADRARKEAEPLSEAVQQWVDYDREKYLSGRDLTKK